MSDDDLDKKIDIGAGVTIDKRGIQRACRDIIDLTPPLWEIFKILLLAVNIVLNVVIIFKVFS